MTKTRDSRSPVRDRLPSSTDPPTLVKDRLGIKQSLTPEGFLLCEDVPIARVGEMVYGPGEVPVEPGSDGLIYIVRDEEALFDPDTLASFNLKPVVNEHPDDDVTPANWRRLAIGTAFNVRQGTGDDADVMIADLLITDEQAIADIKAGKREVSNGYEADYEDLGGGRGRQTNIIGKHIALVQKGRCGPRCAIGDHHPFEQEHEDMTQRVHIKPGGPSKPRVQIRDRDRVRKMIRDMAIQDPELLDDVRDDLEEGVGATNPVGESQGLHVHIHQGGGEGKANDTDPDPNGSTAASGFDEATEARFASLEQGHQELKAQNAQILELLQAMKPAGTGDSGGAPDPEGKKTGDEEGKKEEEEEGKGAKTGDSAALADSYKQVLADAEILVPGFRMPTFDAALPRAKTVDLMCNYRRRALDAFYATGDGAQVVNTITGKDELDVAALGCAEVASLFKSAAGAQKLLNNNAATRDANRVIDPNTGANKGNSNVPKSIADLNSFYRQHYAGKKTQA